MNCAERTEKAALLKKRRLLWTANFGVPEKAVVTLKGLFLSATSKLRIRTQVDIRRAKSEVAGQPDFHITQLLVLLREFLFRHARRCEANAAAHSLMMAIQASFKLNQIHLIKPIHLLRSRDFWRE